MKGGLDRRVEARIGRMRGRAGRRFAAGTATQKDCSHRERASRVSERSPLACARRCWVHTPILRQNVVRDRRSRCGLAGKGEAACRPSVWALPFRIVTQWQNLQNVSAEIQALLANTDDLRRADAQEVIQDWVEAQGSTSSPEILCARLIKALSDVAAFCSARNEPLGPTDLRTALRAALGVPESRRPSKPCPPTYT